MKGYLLDTHVWLWVQTHDVAEVSSGLFAEVETWQRNGEAFLSDASIWEVARLAADGHVDLATTVDEFIREATVEGGLQLIPISTRLVVESTRLPGDLHRDPLDRVLIATAREHDLTLVTLDKVILRYAKAGHVRARKC
jgi:PIN domain nuclease of toxin-antitoxin system